MLTADVLFVVIGGQWPSATIALHSAEDSVAPAILSAQAPPRSAVR